MESSHPPLVRTRLSIMMLLEFFVWGGWYFAIGGYAGGPLEFTGGQIGWLYSTTALGAIIAPLFVGYVADRLFSTEKMLCVLHLLGGASLLFAAQQESFPMMLAALMLNGAFFMPTLALANSLAFRHIPDASKFPRIAVLGTIGWIVANLVGEILGGVETPNFFYLAGGGGIVMALYCLTLPHTPPKGGEGGGDVLGLKALQLLKEPSFLVFTISMFLIAIPACFFFAAIMTMLRETGFAAPLALNTLNQFSEIVFMFTMPLFIAGLGMKRVLLIGMLAWAIRFLCFASSYFPMTIVGLLLHGFCYSFVFVGAYMYVDKRAPADLKASAQSFIAFLMLGVGWFIGTRVGGEMMDVFPPPVGTMEAIEVTTVTENDVEKEVRKEKPDAPLPAWNDPDAETNPWRFLNLAKLVEALSPDDEKEKKVEKDLAGMLDTDGNQQITLAEVEAIPAEGVKIGKYIYHKDAMIETFEKVVKLKESDGEGEASITRDDWLAASRHDWASYWLWPAIAAFVVCAFFMLAFHDEPPEDEETAGEG